MPTGFMIGPAFPLSRSFAHSIEALSSVDADGRSGVVGICNVPPDGALCCNRRLQEPEKFNRMAYETFWGLLEAIGTTFAVSPLDIPVNVVNSHPPVRSRGDYTLDR